MSITTFNTNLAAFGAQRNLKVNNNAVTSSLSKLSSGLRVPTAKDDAAALAIGSNLRAEVAGLRQASTNAGQAVSLLQIAEGAMGQVSDILVRMKSLAVQASSGQLSNTDRSTLNAEFVALRNEIDRIADDTEFNGTKLINASGTATQTNFNATNGAAYTSYVNPTTGFASIEFGNSVGDGAFEVTYTAATNLMTLTNKVTGAAQSINIGATAIAAGSEQVVNFNSLDTVVRLNSFFDKTANLGAADALTSANYTGLTVSASSIRITSVAQDPTPSVAPAASTTLDFGSLNSSRFQLTGLFSAPATVTLTGLYEDGGAATLTGTVTLDSVGLKTVALSDANGNTINLEFNVATAATAGTGVANADFITVNELGNYVGTRGIATTGSTFNFKVGTGIIAAEDTISFAIDNVDSTTLGIGGASIDSAANADTAIGLVNTAISTLSASRADVGAAQSRLDYATNNLAVSIENSEAARSALLDVDVAQEITNFTTKQVLVQAGVSLLAQANQLPQNLLQLLQ